MKSNRTKFGFPIIFTIILFIVSCADEGENNRTRDDLSDLYLKGKVKKLTERNFEGLDKQFGKVQKGDLVQTFTYSFNKKGYKIEETTTNPYSTDLFITHYNYDNHNNLIEKYTIDTENVVPINKSVWEYNSKNNLISLMYYNPGSTLSWKETYNYDKSGSLIESIGYEGDGLFNRKRIKKYDKGRIIEDHDYSHDGRVEGKTTYKYDERNRLAEENRFSPEGDLYYRHVTSYDENDIISETSVSYLNMPYDYLNNLTIKKFDKQGNIVEESKYDQNGQIIYKNIFEYPVYDKNGNWLTKVIIMEMRGERTLGSTYGVTERQIEYY